MITVTVQTRHDGNYWVCECPLFRLVSADPSQDKAEDSIFRMVQAQILYGLQNDPGLLCLTRDRVVAHQILDENKTDTGVVIKCEFFQQAGHRVLTLPRVQVAPEVGQHDGSGQ